MLFIVTTVVREPSEVLCAVNSGGHVEAECPKCPDCGGIGVAKYYSRISVMVLCFGATPEAIELGLTSVQGTHYNPIENMGVSSKTLER